MNQPITAAQIASFNTVQQNLLGATPRFAMTHCSQCGRDTGPGDAGHSSCATHTKAPAMPDLSGLIDYEFTTANGVTLRCYLDYEEAVDGGRDYPSNSEHAELVYAFAGLIDVADLVEQIPAMKQQIETEALADQAEQRKHDQDDAAIARHINLMDSPA